MAIETLFVIDRQAYTSVVIENIPRSMILNIQKLLKDHMNSPGKMTSVLSSSVDCLRITKVHKSNKVAVVKYGKEWLMSNRSDVFYVDYNKTPMSIVYEAFNSGNFRAFSIPIESVETYSVF